MLTMTRKPPRTRAAIEVIYRDDSDQLCREVYRSIGAALQRGQSLAAYGLSAWIKHTPHGRPVRCVA